MNTCAPRICDKGHQQSFQKCSIHDDGGASFLPLCRLEPDAWGPACARGQLWKADEKAGFITGIACTSLPWAVIVTQTLLFGFRTRGEPWASIPDGFTCFGVPFLEYSRTWVPGETVRQCRNAAS